MEYSEFTLFDYIPLGVCVIDSDYSVIYWNECLQQWTGINRNEIDASHIGDKYPLFRDMRYSIRIDQIFKGSPPIFFSGYLHPKLFPIRLPNRIFRILNMTITSLRRSATQGYLAMILLQDVTDLEVTIAKYREEIQHSQKLNQHLMEANEIADKAVKIKSQFLSNMSHEIRTPLSGIIGLLTILEKTDLRENQREYVEILQQSSNHLLSIVNDILDLSKIEAGKNKISHEIFHLFDMLNRLYKVYEPTAQAKDLDFILEISQCVPSQIVSDERALYQILSNIVSNSIKFTDKGCVGLELTCTETELEFKLFDTGIGISETDLEIIFEPFSQLDNSLTKKFSGTGLGLAIVKNLVEALRGKLKITSELEKGTQIFVTVPYQLPVEDAIDIDLLKNSKINSKARILIAEDNQVNAIYIETILSGEGYSYTTVSNGAEVLESLKEQVFDLILMDIQMPVLDGFACAERIREHPDESIRNTPIIAVTGFATDNDRSNAIKAGMNDFITKPINRQELTRSIKSFIHSG